MNKNIKSSKLAWASILLALVAPCSFAKTGVDTIKALPSLPDLSSMALGLAAVIVAILVLSMIARRITGLKILRGSANLKLLQSMSLGTKEKLVIVEVEGQRLLLGVTATQIRTLHVIPPESNNFDSDGNAEDTKFSKNLKAVLSKGIAK